MEKEFIKYLEEAFMRSEIGSTATKDSFETKFDYWLSTIDTNDLITYADHWGQQMYRSGYESGTEDSQEDY